jgi:hypothetical protein
VPGKPAGSVFTRGSQKSANDIAWLIVLTASNCDQTWLFERRWLVLEKTFEGLVTKDGVKRKMN